jgi:hypothetical protein
MQERAKNPDQIGLKIAKSRVEIRHDLLLTVLRLMSSKNSKDGLASELQYEMDGLEADKKYYPDYQIQGTDDHLYITNKYPLLSREFRVTPESIYRNNKDLDFVIAKKLGQACFHCLGRSGEQECYIPTLPENDMYRYIHAFGPWYRELEDRQALKEQLKADQNVICIPPYKPSSLVDN